LAEQLQIRYQSAVGLVNRLMAQGFFARKQSLTDRRQVYATPSSTGLATLEQLAANEIYISAPLTKKA
jgi:DNA-binding MarR family transcriptional regulator